MGFMDWLSDKLGTSNRYDPTDPNAVANAKANAPVNKFHADQANLPSMDYRNNIGNTLKNAQANYGQQQSFIDTIRARSQGQGPSVAQSMLRQASGENAASTAAAVGSNRSLSPALQGRLIAQSGSEAGQRTVGQLATLRAQEIATNEGLLGQALGQQGSQNLGVMGTLAGAQQGTSALALQDALGTESLNAGVSAQNAGLQMGQEQLDAGVGAQDASTNAGILGGVLNAAGTIAAASSDARLKTDVHRLRSEALPGVPEATFRYKGSPTPHRGVVAQDVEKKYPELVGRRSDGMRTVPASLMRYAQGGAVSPLYSYLDEFHGKKLAYGGGTEADPFGSAGDGWMSSSAGLAGAETGTPSTTVTDPAGAGSKKKTPTPTMQFFKPVDSMSAYNQFAGRPVMGSIYAHGGPVPAMVSPQEVVIPPEDAKNPARAAARVERGVGKVPGKAKVKGDSAKNDVIHARLEAGSVVIPRSITQGENAPERAASFVASLMNRSGGKRYARGGKVRGGRDMSKGGMA